MGNFESTASFGSHVAAGSDSHEVGTLLAAGSISTGLAVDTLSAAIGLTGILLAIAGTLLATMSFRGNHETAPFGMGNHFAYGEFLYHLYQSLLAATALFIGSP